jgi:serine/threonine-protein kinase RsbW
MALESGAHQLLDETYPSTLDSVDAAEAEILKAAGTAGFDEDEQHRIGMAVRECVVNAVVHGNRYNRNKKVRVRASLAAQRLTVSIADEGEGFEMEQIPDPLHDNNLLRHSGRGLFLMGAFMDELKVRRIQPVGTEVTLIKKVKFQDNLRGD